MEIFLPFHFSLRNRRRVEWFKRTCSGDAEFFAQECDSHVEVSMAAFLAELALGHVRATGAGHILLNSLAEL